MTWHSESVARDQLATLLQAIQRSGGTIVSACHRAGAVMVTWTTA